MILATVIAMEESLVTATATVKRFPHPFLLLLRTLDMGTATGASLATATAMATESGT